MQLKARNESTRRGVVARLGPLVVSRGLDQLVLGVASLLVARRVGAGPFAPFALYFIAYSVAGQLADGGLAFAVLRTPPTASLDQAALRDRRLAWIAIAAGGTVIGWALDGTYGHALAVASVLVGLAGETFLRRAVVQRAGAPVRQAFGESAGAALFLVLVLALVDQPADLPVLGWCLLAKLCLESWVLGGVGSAFSEHGKPARATSEWVGQAVTYSTANVDYLIIGVIFGPVALSLYSVSFRVGSAISAVLAAPLTRAAFIDLAAGGADRRRVHDTLLRRVAVWGATGTCVTLATAQILPIVLGQGWRQAATLTAILSLALPWRLALGPVVALGVTSGRAGRVARLETGRFLMMAGAVLAGSVGGVVLACGAATAACIVGIARSERKLAAGIGIEPSTTVAVVTAATATFAVVAGLLLRS